MPVISRTRTIDARPERIWTTVADPDHLPRWWPRVARVEDADRAQWTAVLTSEKGRSLRADYSLVDEDHPHRRTWRHEVEETPFERILSEAIWQIDLERADDPDHTEVTITARLKLRGFSRFGGMQMRMATRKQIEEALDGLERIAW